jgi:DNA-binding NarL/FixJ family response regulator
LIRAELPGTAIIVLSAHVEVEEAMELLASGEGTGYLLKSRVTNVAEFIETVGRIAAGGSVVDPSLVQELIRARRRRDPLDVLSPREREVLALMAEGASNAGIARRIFVTEGTVEKHIRSILTKLDLVESETEHRRVMAVLRFLEARLFLLAGSQAGCWPGRQKRTRPRNWTACGTSVTTRESGRKRGKNNDGDSGGKSVAFPVSATVGFPLAAMRRHRTPGTIIGCLYGVC